MIGKLSLSGVQDLITAEGVSIITADSSYDPQPIQARLKVVG
jgi:hypothetical protein